MTATENLLKLWKETRSAHKDINHDHSFKNLEKLANIFSAGPYYYYVLNHLELKIDYVHPTIEEVLEVAPGHFTLEKYLERVHPDDVGPMYQKENTAIRFLMEKIPPEKIPHYKISYLNRLMTGKGVYKTILHQAVPLVMTNEHKIGYMLTVHTDISFLNIPFDHKISIVSLTGARSWYGLHPEKPAFSSEDLSELFSEREREVLSMISEGKKSKEIAGRLSLSVETVSTHRKNILSKTACKNTTELIAKSIRSGLI